VALKELEQLPSNRSLQAPPDVADALALRPAAGGVGPRFYVVAQPRQHNRVQRAVELPVTRAV